MTITTLDYPGLLRLLGSMYLESPAPDTIGGWQAALDGEVPAALLPLKESVQAADPADESGIRDLETEFARLFVGPAAVPCPPWESMYTSPNRKMMQQAYDDMAALYADAGLKVAVPGVMPDHISAELGFLALLLGGLPNGSSRDPLVLADRLIDEHLNKWIGPFTADLERAARLPLYRELARATRSMLSLLQE